MNQPVILDCDNSWDGEERGRGRVQGGKECGRGGGDAHFQNSLMGHLTVLVLELLKF